MSNYLPAAHCAGASAAALVLQYAEYVRVDLPRLVVHIRQYKHVHPCHRNRDQTIAPPRSARQFGLRKVLPLRVLALRMENPLQSRNKRKRTTVEYAS